MNIFFLDYDPVLAAQYQCNRHVIKMVLESTQLLCSAHHVLGINPHIKLPLYKLTHKNHPCAKWVRDCDVNYYWLSTHAIALCQEYTHRYNKTHKCEPLIWQLHLNLPLMMSRLSISNPPQCMPDEYKQVDVVAAYRNYYIGEKAYFAKWTKRQPPEWWTVDKLSTTK